MSTQNAKSTKVQYTTTTEDDCYSLLVGDGLVAAVTHTHLELESHEGDGGAFGRTFATHGLATLPAVVLKNTVGLQHVSFDYQQSQFLPRIRKRVSSLIIGDGPTPLYCKSQVKS